MSVPSLHLTRRTAHSERESSADPPAHHASSSPTNETGKVSI